MALKYKRPITLKQIKLMEKPLSEIVEKSFIDQYGERTFNRMINEETLPKETPLKGRDLFA
jgi:hypothetical protein